MFLNSLILGIIIVAVGTIVSFIIGIFLSEDLPPVCKDWNKNYVMEIALLLTGILSYPIFIKVSS